MTTLPPINHDFRTKLESIAKDPKGALQKFEVIPEPHKTIYTKNRFLYVISIVTAVFAAVTAALHRHVHNHYIPLSLAFLSIAALNFSYHSKSIRRTVSIKQECEIENFFNPCIEGLRAAAQVKAQEICTNLEGRAFEEDKVAPSIEFLSKNYNQEESGKWFEKEHPEFDFSWRLHYNNLKDSAQVIETMKLGDLPVDVAEYAKRKFAELQNAAYLFSHGYEKAQEEPAKPFVDAKLVDGKAQAKPWIQV